MVVDSLSSLHLFRSKVVVPLQVFELVLWHQQGVPVYDGFVYQHEVDVDDEVLNEVLDEVLDEKLHGLSACSNHLED